MCVSVVVFIRVLLKFESMSGSGEGLDLNVKVNIYYENYIGSIIKNKTRFMTFDSISVLLFQMVSVFAESLLFPF